MTERERLITITDALARLEIAVDATARARLQAVTALGLNHDAADALADADELLRRARAKLQIVARRLP